MKFFILVALSLLFFPFSGSAVDPLGVPDRALIEYPDEEEPSEDLVQLGEVLFFDTRLSLHDNQSCGTCHNPDLGFGEGIASGIGTMGGGLGRNTPHIYNLAWSSIFMWDGRMPTLEKQALGPIQAAGEMNMSLGKLLPKLKKVPYYQRRFSALFPDSGIIAENIGIAIAAFERTIIVDNTPFDRYLKGNLAAIDASAIRGMKLFEGKANCIQCHGGANFTDDGFHNIGIGDKDNGRYEIQKGATNRGAFKTPGLRNTLLTAPYMHNGSLPSLEAVVLHYNKGGNTKRNLDSLIKPLGLTKQEIFDLVAFLGTLTQPLIIERPQIP